jgi:hypothetical protein
LAACTFGLKYKIYLVEIDHEYCVPRPDPPETENKLPQRHQNKRQNIWLIFIFASLCVSGVNVWP